MLIKHLKETASDFSPITAEEHALNKQILFPVALQMKLSQTHKMKSKDVLILTYSIMYINQSPKTYGMKIFLQFGYVCLYQSVSLVNRCFLAGSDLFM